MKNRWNVIVIGGGHAGIEAAYAAAKFGPTALLVGNPATIGRMPCNPSVGGPGKSQLVFELHALGGLMPTLADQTAIHTRVLNASKGPAVQSLRVQNERDLYATVAQDALLGVEELDILRGEAADLESDDDGGWWVITTDGRKFWGRSVVIAAGTFMRGVTWYGRQSRHEGRQGEPPSRFLSGALERGGHMLKRFKTGTPPRIRADSVRFADLDVIPADVPARSFSGQAGPMAESSPTWQTHTTPTTHALVAENIGESAMYAGDIDALGARYCPSIEDKIMRFAHHDRHLLFVEPEGLETSEVYLQGFSSSLPPQLQDKLVRTLPGFEQAVIQRYAYAVEYDVMDSTGLTMNLESRLMAGVYSAGQINGTSGYEEAAMQGLVAGTAAARRAAGLSEHTFSRADGYLGVLLDDLILKGCDEPFRMMTSRVEHRLLVRQDNADERLTPLAHELGLVDADRLAAVRAKYERVGLGVQALAKARLDGKPADLYLRRPEVTLDSLTADLAAAGVAFPELSREEREAVEIRVKYAGYLDRARRQLEAEAKAGHVSLRGVDFAAVPSLSLEGREKLLKHAPTTIEQASRIQGVRHADVSALLVYLKARSAARMAGRETSTPNERTSV